MRPLTPQTVASDIDGTEIKVGDKVCYAKTVPLATPILVVAQVTEIIEIPGETTSCGYTQPTQFKVKMGRMHTIDSNTRIKII